MKNLLVVLAILSFNVAAAEEVKPENIDRHYNTCRSSELALKSAKQQETFYRNQLLFTLEKGSTFNKKIIEQKLAQLESTRSIIQKIYDDLKCARHFNLKKADDK